MTETQFIPDMLWIVIDLNTASIYESAIKREKAHFVLLPMIIGNTEMPDAIETVFQSALAFGRHGGVSTQ